MATSAHRPSARPGQAFMELAVGMLALSLVFAAVFGFSGYIVRSLDMQRDIRAKAGKAALNGHGASYSSVVEHDKVEVEPLAADYIFGTTEIEIREEVHMPNMGINDVP